MKHLLLLLWIGFLCFGTVMSQPLYNMSNATVDDCKGILVDSDAGTLAGHYDHDENFTFTICVPGASSITISFSAFCTELDYDSLRIFDGADTFATQLGPSYTGTNVPPTVSSTGNCLTINFISDANVTCTGWVAQWTTEIEEPILPEMNIPIPTPSCSTSTFLINFDTPIPCDSLYAGALSLSGPSGGAVTGVTPIGCTNDSASSAQVTLGSGMNQSGSYTVTYTSFFLDQCDSLWTLTTADSFSIVDCPLEVYLTATSDTICIGECTDLFADAYGGDVTSYNYSWTPILSNSPGPHTVCPLITTTYVVSVSDASGATPAADTITIIVIPAPVLVPASLTICETASDTQLVGFPPNGWWDGPGITDNSGGIFHPDSAGPGNHIITYYSPDGCATDLPIDVIGIDAGLPIATCPGAPPFQVFPLYPAGGTWSGPNISMSGIYSPPFTYPDTTYVTYTANGCTDIKTIYSDTISLVDLDTLCQTSNAFFLTFSPLGGIWSGDGILDTYWGYFDPDDAGPGNHVLTYTVAGCVDSIDVFVKQLSIGGNIEVCPSAGPFILTPPPSPSGGTWVSSQGSILDPVTGLFDPGINGGNDYNDTLTYSIGGCSGSRIVRVRETVIGYNPDTAFFCRYDGPFALSFANVQRNPGGGVWTGTGVTSPKNPGTFEPVVAGPGIHELVYTANGCSDTLIVSVLPSTTLPDTMVCASASPFTIGTTQPGGIWSGVGISDTSLGVFDPQIAGTGDHEVYYESPFGCRDTTSINVFPLPALQIGKLDAQYCYKDSAYTLTVSPPGGTLSGPGIVGNTFNPTLAGPGGPYLIEYTFGRGDCEQTTVAITNVSPPLEVATTFDEAVICFGEYLTVGAEASGGATGIINYTWNEGLGVGQSHPVNPPLTTTFIVTVEDGCSAPATDSVHIQVQSAFSLEFETSEKICYGETGYALALVEGTSEYSYLWNTSPPQKSDSLVAPTGFNYQVTITDVVTGCEITGTTEIPRHPFVLASFQANPSASCKTTLDPTFSFVDRSSGSMIGYWDFGDGTEEPYVYGVNPQHRYDTIGEFQVHLYLENEGGCFDSASQTVCVLPEPASVYFPNAFTPNGDLINDVFSVGSAGFIDYHLQIYDRWGTIVFESSQPEDSWDGKFNNVPVPEGVYVYLVRGKMISDNPRTSFKPVNIRKKGSVTLFR